MSHYTTQIRWIVETLTPNSQNLSVSARITEACPKIFNFFFPIFDENHRPELEKKILLHYYTREIGLETVGLWKLYLEERLNLIMPYYNMLYEAESNKFDFLNDVDLTEKYTGTTVGKEIGDFDGNQTSNSTQSTTSSGNIKDNGSFDNNQNDTTTTSKTDNTNTSQNSLIIDEGTSSQTKTGNNLQSDLPQANYNNLDYGTNLIETSENTQNTTHNNQTQESTNHTNTTSNGTVTLKSDSSGTNQNTQTYSNSQEQTNNAEFNQTSNNTVNRNENKNYNIERKGLSGSRSYASLLMEYRQSIINIDKMIIDELKDLFMTIY